MNIQKVFIILGIVFILIGLFGSWFGKLPGDLMVKRGNVRFYFPLMTSILLSIILSLIFYIFGKFR